MATGGNPEQLNNRQIVRLAAAISADNMESVAEGYMDIETETVKNIWIENQGKTQAFNRAIIRHWANKNPADQVKRLAALLFQAAEECSYVDPVKVQQILNEVKEDKHDTKKCTVSEGEFLDLAEKLRLHTAATLKMETAPWIQDDVVDMEKLYTELTLEKIDKKPFKEECSKLENYRELFASLKPVMFKPMTKILLKGRPGIGKTSLVKKITWDWAKRLFVNVSIVFFVFLKLVNPGDAIENVIIDQTPVLEGLNITGTKIKTILETFGSRCLLILDGLDEHALGQNQDVIKIIEGRRYLSCNIIVTSRPHSTKNIKKYFESIVSVEGFTCSEAKKFALQILPPEKVEQVLHFNPAGDRSDRPIHNVPILLTFLCLLIREDNIDLSHKSISLGEIYFRMVRCLYKKFTLRKGIDFQMNALLRVLKSLGKLALETLLSPNQLLKRRQVIEQVDENVFEYGLLIGEDRSSLTGDPTVDILVTFPHPSLQEFLGAFFLVVSPEEVQKLYGDKIYNKVLSESLFLQFCFWFLKKSDELLFSFQQKQSAIKLLAAIVADQVDNVGVGVDLTDIVRMLPSFQILGNDIILEILTSCRKMKYLKMDSGRLTKKILSSLGPAFKSLKSIEISTCNKETTINEFMTTDEVSANDIHVFMSITNADSDFEILNTIFVNCVNNNKKLFLHIDYDGPKHLELKRLLHKTMKGLKLVGCRRQLPVISHEGKQELVNLTNLSLSRLVVRNVQLDRFPQLTSVSLSGCDTEDGRCLLSRLFSSKCPNLKHLSCFNIIGGFNAVNFLGNANANLNSSNIPNLDSLALSSEIFAHEPAVFQKIIKIPWTPLKCFRLNCINKYIYNVFITALNDKKFMNLVELCLYFQNGGAVNIDALDLGRLPYLKALTLHRVIKSSGQINRFGKKVAEHKLEYLDISHHPVLREELVRFLIPEFQCLEALILGDCQLNTVDLICLKMANVHGRLPRLRRLDLSYNDLGESLSTLLVHPFPLLKELILTHCSLNSHSMQCLARARFQGVLPKNKLLNVAENFDSEHNTLELLTVEPETKDKITWKNIIYDVDYGKSNVYVTGDVEEGISDVTDCEDECW